LAGHGARDGSMSEGVRNNTAFNRFELDVDGTRLSRIIA
jgi:hypothetical protein